MRGNGFPVHNRNFGLLPPRLHPYASTLQGINAGRRKGGLVQRRPRKGEKVSRHETAVVCGASASPPACRLPGGTYRRLLLAGTALVSTLLIVSAVPTPAEAVNCTQPATPAPINQTGVNAPIVCVNTEARTNAAGYGIALSTINSNAIYLSNSGTLMGFGGGDAGGLYAATAASTATPLTIYNSGGIQAQSTGGNAFGISASGVSGQVTIVNSGDLDVVAAQRAVGIGVTTSSYPSTTRGPISITNSASISAASSGGSAYGIYASSYGKGSGIEITNTGSVSAAHAGVFAKTGTGLFMVPSEAGVNAPIKIVNTGSITTRGYGIFAQTAGTGSAISITNSGDIDASGANAYGVFAIAASGDDVTVKNTGRILVTNGGTAVSAQAFSGDVTVVNHGDIMGGGLGLLASGDDGTVIVNHGSISATSLYAIKVVPSGFSQASIVNYGDITGYIKVFGYGDQFLFDNRGGGVFEARGTSRFGDGFFLNHEGATVHTASNARRAEVTTFYRITSFHNRGLISMVDGAAGDTFHLQRYGGGYGPYENGSLVFYGDGQSTLAVDTYLGGQGSQSDTFIIDGAVKGRTKLEVTNTNPLGGSHNPAGIPVVFGNGPTAPNAFYLDETVYAGLFDYDLFFVPTGSGYWELRGSPGRGAHVLPHLVTHAHDVFHATTDTWFDRTTDLRVLLELGDRCPSAEKRGPEGTCPGAVAPGMWVRAGGSWLDQDDRETTKAFGRTYRYDLERELDVMNLEVGIDFGTENVLTGSDMLVFGVLGGVIHSELDYKNIARQFNATGGEVGVYATYLNDGLFVDTLAKAHFMSLDPEEVLGLPDDLDSNAYGLRTDAGYRFGGFASGPFIEPLATLAVSWADVEDFVVGANAVDFGEDAQVRGRVGVRLGSTMDVWGTTLMEPFVIGSLWGTLSGDHTATVVSNGTKFQFVDEPSAAWAVVSTGVNFFTPSANTSVFAKLDVTLGEDVSGVGGRAGLRLAW